MCLATVIRDKLSRDMIRFIKFNMDTLHAWLRLDKASSPEIISTRHQGLKRPEWRADSDQGMLDCVSVCSRLTLTIQRIVFSIRRRFVDILGHEGCWHR